MSFGLLISDFLVVGKLIADITLYLKEVGRSKSEYREVVFEFEYLQKALIHLDRLQPYNDIHNVDTIKYTALNYKRPLEDFLAKLKHFKVSLGLKITGPL